MNPHQKLRRLYLYLQLMMCVSIGAPTAHADSDWLRHLRLQGDVELLQMPDGHGYQAFEQAIQGAERSISMVMFRLTDERIASALIAAAQRGVDVKIILDGRGVRGGTSRTVFHRLLDNGVKVRPSSRFFSITHAKSMVVDDARAFVTSINLTASNGLSRDFGVVTSDQGVITELRRVFLEDWRNSFNNDGWTPRLQDPHLIWSPVNARLKLVDLIDSATQTIDVMSQNISDPIIMKALAKAAGRQVRVRLLVPFCDKGNEHFFNVPYVRKLVRSNVDGRLMPYPATPTQPYIHAKAMIVDQAKAYIGSINLTTNSTIHARELGIVINDQEAIQKMRATFNSDWSRTIKVPDRLPATCTP